MKKLLIHGNNTCLNSEELFSYDEQFGFDIDFGKNVDEYIHEKLNGELGEKLSKSDIAYIKIALSENYLEYLGIRLAYHIRLTTSLKKKRFIPIIFIAQESFQFLGLTANNPSILFTGGIYLIKESFKELNKSYEQFKNGIITPVKDYQNFINSIIINPPSNYNSHHSIDNELALLRWSEYLKFDKKTLKVEEVLRTSLFFKYHKLKNPIKPVKKGNRFLISEQGKILLIDDEAGKGWAKFYEHFFEFNINTKSIEFDSFGENFKSCETNKIINTSLEKVKEFKPNLVLLDLRLCDGDFNSNSSPKDLTGYQILNSIKEINKGIQVIITTASDKVWNYEALLDQGITGYILKSGKSDISEDISNLKNKIELGLKSSVSLMKFDEISRRIVSHINSSNEWKDEFKIKVKDYLDISFNFLKNSFKDNSLLRYAYLQLFLIIEDFLNQEQVFIPGDMCYVNTEILIAQKTEDNNNTYNSIICRNSKTGIYKIENCEHNHSIGVDYKMSAVLIFIYGYESSDIKNWHKLNYLRNKAAHESSEELSINSVLELLDFIKFLTDSSRKNVRDASEGLSELNFDERVQILKEKFEGPK